MVVVVVGEVVTEESVQFWLSEMLADPRYAEPERFTASPLTEGEGVDAERVAALLVDQSWVDVTPGSPEFYEFVSALACNLSAGGKS